MAQKEPRPTQAQDAKKASQLTRRFLTERSLRAVNGVKRNRQCQKGLPRFALLHSIESSRIPSLPSVTNQTLPHPPHRNAQTRPLT